MIHAAVIVPLLFKSHVFSESHTAYLSGSLYVYYVSHFVLFFKLICNSGIFCIADIYGESVGTSHTVDCGRNYSPCISGSLSGREESGDTGALERHAVTRDPHRR